MLRIELLAQAGRFILATSSVAIGVGLALAIHLVNQSALHEFSQALAVVNGQAQSQLLPIHGDAMDEAVYQRLLTEPILLGLTQQVNPVIEFTAEFTADMRANDRTSEATGAQTVRILGIDPLRTGFVSPRLMPIPAGELDSDSGAGSLLFADDSVFLSSALARKLALVPGDRVSVGRGRDAGSLRYAGGVPGVGPEQMLAVMDIGTLQWRLGWVGKLTRIDLLWNESIDTVRSRRELLATLGPEFRLSDPEVSGQQISNLSRAYRVNLTVLSLVATFTGGFLVWTSLSAAIAKQTRSLAVLGMLGVSRIGLARLILLVGLMLGVAGATGGVLLGIGLANALLRIIGNDLGAGYFSGAGFALDLNTFSIAPFFMLGLLTALAGAWGPAKRARQLSFTESLRGLQPSEIADGILAPLLLFGVGALLLLMPAIQGLPLAAYLAIALWLFAAIQCTAHWLRGFSKLLARFEGPLSRVPVLWLAAQRSLGDRLTAKQSARSAAAVVASFALTCAMATMVYSFRGSVADWLTRVLPADLYARAGQQAGQGRLSVAQQQKIRSLAGLDRVEFVRSVPIALSETLPAITLLARPLSNAEISTLLPITGAVIAAPQASIAVYASETAAALHNLRPGSLIKLPGIGDRIGANADTFFVSAIWRDYARQNGAVAIDLQVYQTLTQDLSINELAIWTQSGVAAQTIIDAANASTDPDLSHLQWRTAGELRSLSLRIFDRSFALTYVLEAIAILVALIGVTASFGSQTLARLSEFSVSRYLGFSRADILRQLCAESMFVLSIAVLWGLTIGIAIAAVLVFRVNPQSFHWTMEMRLPGFELLVAGALLIMLGCLAAVMTAKRVMQPRLHQSLKDDW